MSEPPDALATPNPAPGSRAAHDRSAWGEATRLIHADDSAAVRLGATARTVNPPIQRASTVLMPDAARLYADNQPSYGRTGLGVQAALEQALAELEGGPKSGSGSGSGAPAVVNLFSSGAAAVTGALMTVLSSGDELLMTSGAYRPTWRLAQGPLKRFGIRTRAFPPRAGVDEVMALVGPDTRAIFLESPASLTFELQDVAAIAAAARARGLITLMDNTWGAGVLFKPLAAGVDLSIQALTKYASGGSDVFLGSVAAADPALGRRVWETVRDTGWSVSPDDCYTVLRSLRTLPLRLERHGASALAVAAWLQAQPEVAEVLCPALPASPDHALWRRDCTGLNGLFGVVLRPGPPDEAGAHGALHAFLDTLALFGLGFSWGGFESLAIAGDPQIDRAARPWAAPGPLVRLHVGLEAPGDLITDLRRGLDAYRAACEAAG